MKIIIELSNETAKFGGLAMFAIGCIFLLLSLIASITTNTIVIPIFLLVFAAIFLIIGLVLIIKSIS